jgi:hypothetical protein
MEEESFERLLSHLDTHNRDSTFHSKAIGRRILQLAEDYESRIPEQLWLELNNVAKVHHDCVPPFFVRTVIEAAEAVLSDYAEADREIRYWRTGCESILKSYNRLAEAHKRMERCIAKAGIFSSISKYNLRSKRKKR